MKRKGLLRIYGLVVALGLVGLTTVEAYPVYGNCIYACSDSGLQSGFATYYDCCSSSPFLGCPTAAGTPSAYSWNDNQCFL